MLNIGFPSCVPCNAMAGFEGLCEANGSATAGLNGVAIARISLVASVVRLAWPS